MELKKGLPITSFTKGDIIIKIEPTIKTNIDKDGNIINLVENHFRQVPMRFLGIMYNLIYLASVGGYCDGMETTALLEEYYDGWELYIEPNFLKQ